MRDRFLKCVKFSPVIMTRLNFHVTGSWQRKSPLSMISVLKSFKCFCLSTQVFSRVTYKHDAIFVGQK